MNKKAGKQLNEHIDSDDADVFFQPIVSLRDGTVIGQEVQRHIIRPTEREDSAARYYTAEQEKFYHIFFPQSNNHDGQRGTDRKLFLKVSPKIMNDYRFLQSFKQENLQNNGIQPENIIFEIRGKVQDIESFFKTASHYKNQHYAFMINAEGMGSPLLHLLSNIHPLYLKLDEHFIQDINSDNVKYSFVKSVVEFCKTVKTDLIAEGVNTKKELIALIDLGVQYAQGAFLQKETKETDAIRKEALELIGEMNRRKNHLYNGLPEEVYIANLCTETETLTPEQKGEFVFEKAKNNPDCFGYCIVQDGFVLGIITKNSLIMHLSGRYGFTLYEKKPISVFMDKDFLSTDYKTPINTVSEIAMQRSLEKLYDFIVVTKNGKYMGTVTIRDLLQKSTEIQVTSAKYQNPLTGLPGNIIIEQKITQCISSKLPYCILYIDIDNFKAYNDVYGFGQGDGIIKLLAESMVRNLYPNQFVGHVGGDDFVAVLTNSNAEQYCTTVINDFKSHLPEYYNKKDFEQGYITAENRHGIVETFPLISLSIAGVRDGEQHFSTLVALTEELARLKKKVKIKKGNCYCIQDFHPPIK